MNERRPTYTAVVENDGRFLLVTIRELDIVTQARTWDEVETMARDLIAVDQDIASESFDIRVEPA